MSGRGTCLSSSDLTDCRADYCLGTSFLLRWISGIGNLFGHLYIRLTSHAFVRVYYILTAGRLTAGCNYVTKRIGRTRAYMERWLHDAEISFVKEVAFDIDVLLIHDESRWNSVLSWFSTWNKATAAIEITALRYDDNESCPQNIYFILQRVFHLILEMRNNPLTIYAALINRRCEDKDMNVLGCSESSCGF